MWNIRNNQSTKNPQGEGVNEYGWNVSACPGGTSISTSSLRPLPATSFGADIGWNAPTTPVPPLSIDPNYVGDQHSFVQEESFRSRELPKEMGIKFVVSTLFLFL